MLMSREKNNLKINLIFQTLYQILETCLPLITAPYLARVLGPNQLGVFSYTSSIVAFFALFAMLGTQNYGTKSIASVNDDIEGRSKIFIEIYIGQLVLSFITIIAYVYYLVFICKDNKIVSTIQSLMLIGCLLNINWFFFGIEKFKITVKVNSIVRIFSVIIIFIFVKNTSDLWIYTLIILGGPFISQIYMWLKLKNYVHFKKVNFKDIVKHLKPNFILFLPLFAMSIYHIMDKTMLGYISNYRQSGLYYNADKIINIPIGVISGVSTVLLPRMSHLASSGKIKEAENLFYTSLELVVMVASAMSFGIAAVVTEFIPIFFGPGFEDCIILTIVLSPVLIIKAFSFTARYQYLIPNNKEKDFTISVVLGAITNITINFILIPQLGAMGAVIGTLVAELISCCWQFFVISRYLRIGSTLKRSLSYCIIGLFMYLLVRSFAGMLTNTLLIKIIFEILFGGVIYGLLCFIYWNLIDTKISIYIKDNSSFIRKLFN